MAIGFTEFTRLGNALDWYQVHIFIEFKWPSKEFMHFNFDFNAVQILWTLTFAVHLVLLVVLLGRDRMRRFPWFTASIVLVALRLISTRLLFGRLPQLTMSATFIVMADLTALIGLMVVVEMARRAFAGVARRTWWLWTGVLLAVGATVLAQWGPWPAWKSLAVDNRMAALGVMQLVSQKGLLLVQVLNIALGVLVLFFGRRFGAGWRSHLQQIVVGLSTASIAQIAEQAIFQAIIHNATPHTRPEYLHLVDLREKLFNANSAVYVAVVIWWIACLWIDEPAATPAAEEAHLITHAPESDPISVSESLAAPKL